MTGDDRWFEREKQVEMAHALVDMLTKADAADLPPMQWTVHAAAGSNLYGETDGPLDHNPRATFTAWVDWLGLNPGKPYVNNRLGLDEQRASGSYRYRGRAVPVGICMTSDRTTKAEEAIDR